jgi:hypothetical protein
MLVYTYLIMMRKQRVIEKFLPVYYKGLSMVEIEIKVKITQKPPLKKWGSVREVCIQHDDVFLPKGEDFISMKQGQPVLRLRTVKKHAQKPSTVFTYKTSFPPHALLS